jgi:uncharacterized damage-inducible protein DinB
MYVDEAAVAQGARQPGGMAMTTREMLLEELDLEMEYTRKTLERVPENQMEWKPDEKSMTLGVLSGFMAIMPTWGQDAITQEGFDAGAMEGLPPLPKTRSELLATFDRNASDLRKALSGLRDADLDKTWTLRAGQQVFFTQPRWLVYRTYFLNHLVHHRGQLTVYLRLLGVPVPAIYNDSADERGGMFIAAAAHN